MRLVADRSDSNDWRAKYRRSGVATDNGREMICTFAADQLLTVLCAMADDLAKAGVKPVLDPRLQFPPNHPRAGELAMRDMFVLAFDDVLPDRARLTPPVAMAAAATSTTVQRFWHRKRIAEVEKHDPDVQAYQERIRTEQAAKRAEHERAQADAAKAKAEASKPKAQPAGPPVSEVAHPAPPPAPPPELPINGHATAHDAMAKATPAGKFDPDGVY